MIDINGDHLTTGIETFFVALIAISLVISALFIIGKGIKVVAHVIDIFRQFFADWNGRPARPNDGIEATHGVLGRLNQGEDERAEVSAVISRVEDKVDAIGARVEHELTPNHGTSIKDGVNEAVMLSEQALNAVFVLKSLMKEWQSAYLADRKRDLDEQRIFFGNVKEMIPMSPEEQGPFWDKITDDYNSALIEVNDNEDTT
jgi:hypothetical protein